MTTTLPSPTIDAPPTVNVDRLRRELEYVTRHRDRWEQVVWIARYHCGTTACLAGNVVLNAGYRPYYEDPADDDTSWIYVDDPGVVGGIPVERDRFVRTVADVAQTLLGLYDDQADRLFQSTNSLYDLWRLAEEFTDGAIQVPSYVLPHVGGHR